MRIEHCTSQGECAIIYNIVCRYEALTKKTFDRQQLQMDIEACHCNGNPLDLQGLFKSMPWDLIHDVKGIKAYLDRTNGKLKDGFKPKHSTEVS